MIKDTEAKQVVRLSCPLRLRWTECFDVLSVHARCPTIVRWLFVRSAQLASDIIRRLIPSGFCLSLQLCLIDFCFRRCIFPVPSEELFKMALKVLLLRHTYPAGPDFRQIILLFLFDGDS